MEELKSLMKYYQRRSIGEQWPRFVGALLAEMRLAYGEDLLAGILLRSGQRMAVSCAIALAATLAELELAINEVLAEQQWGYCRIEELTEVISISHYAAPLATCDEMDACGAYLAGAYQEWLTQAGMPQGLQVHFLPGGDEHCLHLSVVAEPVRERMYG